MKRISLEETTFLERPFEEDEVWLAIKESGSNKSPGPDGFTFGFVKRHWSIIKREVMAAFCWFWEKGVHKPGVQFIFRHFNSKKCISGKLGGLPAY